MPKILVVHHDAGARQLLAAMLNGRYEVCQARSYLEGIQVMAAQRPALIIAGQDARRQDAILLLQYLRQRGYRANVVVLAGRGGGVYQQVAMNLGAKAFLEYPVDEQRFQQTVSSVLGSLEPEASIPPLTAEEETANLTELEKKLNRQMKCFAGKNLVFLQSFIGSGTRSRPRICLKCPLRKEFGLNRDVYYEFIRDVCCADPSACEAVQAFRARQAG